MHKIFAVLGYLLILVAPAPSTAQPIASRYVDEFPQAESKKGLQVHDVADALALGIKHAALNVNLCQMVDLSAIPNQNQHYWEYQGGRFHFDDAYVSHLDRSIRALSESGVVVNLIILAYESTDPRTNNAMLHPKYEGSTPQKLGMFNTATPDGRGWLNATMEFMAERWSRPDRKFGRVAGYIIGNEVNSHWWWCNMGPVTMREFADTYLTATRLMHAAVRRQSSWARIYVSLEHHWGIRYPVGNDRQAFPGKDFIDYFARQSRQGGDFDWHVAYHPYPENLFEPRFWNDTTAQLTDDTPRITFKNLEVLTRYLMREELLYQGHPRRVILSEQGFHTPEGPQGEAIQAAAYCAAYKKVEHLDGVDAFILHRHIDHPHEGGLLLGLRSMHPGDGEPWRKKLIYDCFKAADTPQWDKAFEFALPIVGIEKW